MFLQKWFNARRLRKLEHKLNQTRVSLEGCKGANKFKERMLRRREIAKLRKEMQYLQPLAS